jgi:hypothetical protein
MKTVKNTLVLFLCLVVFLSSAQDFIHKKNREILKVKVIEITSDEIQFKDFDNPNAPMFTIDKAKVSKLELANGDVMEFKPKDLFNDPDYYTGQAKNALKVSFVDFFTNQTTLFYERSITPSSSIEGGISFIGAGFDHLATDNAKGLGLRFGYKFKQSPDYYLDKMRYAHLLKGGYIKPELILTSFSTSQNEYDHSTGATTDSRSSAKVNGSFMLVFGNQSVFNDIFLTDSYLGIGMGFSDSGGMNYGFYGAGDLPLTFTAGFNIGLVFKDKKDRIKK